ncbi:MAG: hypothetical protein NTX64_12815, partial [Elusimicrobia bacterium]|nr:hypothetical protein [Elusimicrobiota bacterium]
MANEQATSKLLSVSNRMRNAALRIRRDGSAMMEFHKDNARLATVMDLALALNELKASLAAVDQAVAITDAKLQKIADAKARAQQGQNQANQNLQNMGQWKKDGQKAIDDDKSQQADMVRLQGQSTEASQRIAAFQNDIAAIRTRIDAEDGGASGSALAEYQRRLALLPNLVDWKTNGKPGNPDYRSLKSMQQLLDDTQGYADKIQKGLDTMVSGPQNMAGSLVLLVPGVPDVSVVNPDLNATQRILADRKVYWQGQVADIQKNLDEVTHRLDPNYSGTEIDDFGDPQPLSLPRRVAQAQRDVQKYQADTRQTLSQIDQLAAQTQGAALPALAGLSLAQLEDALQTYPDKLSAVRVPSDGSDAAFQAKMNILSIGKLLPYAGRSTMRWAIADATVNAGQKVLTQQLPAIGAGVQKVADAYRAVLSDVDQDIAFVTKLQGGWTPGAGESQAIYDRKRALLQNLQGTVQVARDFVQNDLIAFLKDDIASDQPKGDKWAKLFNSEVTLYNAVVNAQNQTLPWALASKGASKGDVGGGLANIAADRKNYQKYLSGYDDSNGHHTGIAEYQLQVQQRKDPNYAGTESVNGETQPFSLPRKISQYSAERAARAQQFDQQAAQLNGILAQIDGLTANRFALVARYSLPTNVDGNSPAGVARLQALVDNNTIQNLGSLLTQIGDEYKAKGGSPSLGTTDGIPTGVQPSPSVSDDLRVALLALQAAKTLVPSTGAGTQDGSAAYAVARVLYSDAVVGAAQSALTNQIPVAEQFLTQGAKALNDAIADLANDEAYVRSNGTGESADSVVRRAVNVYTELSAFTTQAVQFFGLKGQWDQDSLNRLDRIQTYYSSVNTVYSNSTTVDDAEAQALQKIKDALATKRQDLAAQQTKISNWMQQLNRPEESALKRVAEDMSKLQDQTREVLEKNYEYHGLEEEHKHSAEVLDWTLHKLDRAQVGLDDKLAELSAHGSIGALPPALLARIDKLKTGGGAWLLTDTGQATQTLVVPKANFSYFLDQFFSAFRPASSDQNLSSLKNEILANPTSLSRLIPDSKVVDFGDNADGFYLVYQTQFSVPHGLETSSMVTLGNLAKIGGNNVSVRGYTFASPANDGNAPYGDKGVEVQVESIQGKNWVNYLDVDLHRFIQDYPSDTSVGNQAQQSRLLVFDDFAMLLFGDKLYIGLDFALDNAKEKPYYYGDSEKVSWKFNEVMRLNAEQQRVFAKDPRYFMETINLDFTGLDPDLNKNLIIDAKGENKTYVRRQVGPSFDVARLLGSDDAFTVDLYVARQDGTDDYNQTSGGISVLKGFTIKDADGKPFAVISNRATAEKGEVYNTVADRVSVTLPNQGMVFSAEGRLIGDAKTYYLQAGKKVGDHSTFDVGYGRQWVGAPDRLTLSLNSSFTLGELWRAVGQNAGENLAGGDAAKKFNSELNDFYSRQGNDKMVQEMKAAIVHDVGIKLLTQDVGTLSRDIQDLRKKGAFLDNSRVRGMVGFVTNPIGDALGDRLVGGGVTAGTFTELQATRPPKDLIEDKAPQLVNAGLALQQRAIERLQALEAGLVEVGQAQWGLKLARYAALNGQSPVLRAEAEAKVRQAQLRLDQALIRFNLMTGRAPGDPFPFGDLSAQDLEKLEVQLEELVAAPDRVTRILHALDADQVKGSLGPEPLDLMKWVPWVDQVALSIGVQFQDMMANQALTIGGRVRLPVYDPTSKEQDKAYVLESRATIQQIEERYQGFALKAQQERQAAIAAQADAEVAQPRVRAAADELGEAIRAYRNGLASEDRLRGAFERWESYQGEALRGRSSGALARAWSTTDASFAKSAPGQGDPLTVGSFDQAFALAQRNSRSLAEIGLREQAAAAMAEANSHRIQNVKLDLVVGAGLTADGVGWIPGIGMTGVGVTPILTFELKPEELRELQVAQGKAETEMYAALKTQLEINLAVQFYQNAATAKATQAAYWTLDQQTIPRLRQELTQAAGADAKARAQRTLDEALQAEDQVWLAHRQALATLNYLLGRPPEAKLEVALSPEASLAELKRILAVKRPAETSRMILEQRVAVARAVETMADKDLKVEQLRLEPVSMVVRNIGRLLNTLSSDEVGNPDLKAAARVQTLEAERARDAWAKGLDGSRRHLAAQLDVARQNRDQLAGKTDDASQLKHIEWANQAWLLEAGLAALGSQLAQDASRDAAPSSFAGLREGLRQARRDLAAAERPEDKFVFDPEVIEHQSQAAVRYWYAKEALDKTPIDKSYVEGWVEFRLKSQSTPPEVLLALAKLRTDKADRQRRNDIAEAGGEADILLSQFETNVRLERWVERSIATAPQGALRARLDETRTDLLSRLDSQRAAIAALLRLDPATPLETLARLVPEEPAGDGSDLSAIASRFVADAKALEIDHLRRTIFEDGVPESFGNEDGFMQQLKADVIADRMSYKGFTPVVAFGYFRGSPVGGAFLEAPDPRAIERGLTKVLDDSLRRELLSQGRMQELTLKLHLLMTGVQDKSALVEQRQAVVREAEADYKATVARFENGLARPEEVVAAQDAVGRAWRDLMLDAAGLKNDFIELVTELEALGYPAQGRFAPAPRSRPQWMTQEDPSGEFVRYASQAEAVRVRTDDPRERLDLLAAADVEGRRQDVAAVLGLTMASLGRLDPRSNPGWASLLAFLADDVREQGGRADGERVYEAQALREMREAFWHAVPRDAAVEGAFKRLEALEAAKDEARQELLADALGTRLKPTEFVMRDLLLDKYLKAQSAFDAELIKTFQSEEVRRDSALASSLNGLYGLRASLDRQTDEARFGRAMAAMDALVMLQEGRLAALRFERALPSEIDPVALSLRQLQETKERWRSERGDLVPLYALTEVDAKGQRLWNVQGWHTTEEVEGWRAAHRLQDETGADGKVRTFLLPEPGESFQGRRELVGGVDVAEARHGSDAAAAKDNGLKLGVYETLKTSELALTSFDGRPRDGFSVAELLRAGSLGRLFYFSREKDARTDLHPAVHPLKALWDSPDKSETVVYVGRRPLSRDQFPTVESLREYRADLARSANPDDRMEAERFLIVQVGDKGAQALFERARQAHLSEVRGGWLGMKLQGYGFALDGEGRLTEVYLTQGDFDAYRDALVHAAQTLGQAQRSVPAAKAAAETAETAASAARKGAQAEQARFNAAQADAEARLAKQGLKGEALKAAVVKDGSFRDAQASYAKVAEAAKKADASAADARRAVEQAEQAVKDAELLVTRSKAWRLFISRDVSLGFDASQTLVSVSAKPAFGQGGVNESFGPSAGATRVVDGEILAAVLDENGRMVQLYRDPAALEKAAASWT